MPKYCFQYEHVRSMSFNTCAMIICDSFFGTFFFFSFTKQQMYEEHCLKVLNVVNLKDHTGIGDFSSRLKTATDAQSSS